jgi:hypothetical protein
MKVSPVWYICFFLVIISFNRCASTIAMYDQYAYAQVTSLKVDALQLMGKADQDYESNEKQITEIDIKIKKAMEYEKHRPKNEIVNNMWLKISDPKAYLYGAFIDRWRQKKKLEIAFIDDQKRIVGLAFDQIAELESKMSKKK